MKPQGCKATVQGDEYFCAECNLRWDKDSDYVPVEGVRKCGSKTEDKAALWEANRILCPFMLDTGLRQGEIVDAPKWASETRAALASYGAMTLLAHPHYPPMVLHPNEKKFIDVSGIT